jgi:hypothetical protein
MHSFDSRRHLAQGGVDGLFSSPRSHFALRFLQETHALYALLKAFGCSTFGYDLLGEIVGPFSVAEPSAILAGAGA